LLKQETIERDEFEAIFSGPKSPVAPAAANQP
jgi:hypothetical protein